MESKTSWSQRRKRIYTIIDIGTHGDYLSCGYDILYCLLILANLTISILDTFEPLHMQYASLFGGI